MRRTIYSPVRTELQKKLEILVRKQNPRYHVRVKMSLGFWGKKRPHKNAEIPLLLIRFKICACVSLCVRDRARGETTRQRKDTWRFVAEGETREAIFEMF